MCAIVVIALLTLQYYAWFGGFCLQFVFDVDVVEACTDTWEGRSGCWDLWIKLFFELHDLGVASHFCVCWTRITAGRFQAILSIKTKTTVWVTFYFAFKHKTRYEVWFTLRFYFHGELFFFCSFPDVALQPTTLPCSVWTLEFSPEQTSVPPTVRDTSWPGNQAKMHQHP